MTTPTPDGLWFRRYHPRPDAEARLICLPHAGGSATAYHRLSALLPAGVEALSVQYPGRQDRRAEPCAATVTELADRLTPLLLPLADRPLILFGHSMGATLGYEIARRLEHGHGILPRALYVSARRSPTSPRTETVHLLDDDGVIAEMRALSGTASAVLDDEELLRMALPAIRADYRAAETHEHTPGPPVSCPVHALTGTEDPKATVEEVRAWSEHTTGPFTLHTFPGGHFYLTDHWQTLAHLLTAQPAPTA
ncbi:thioesterase II family protein (plasmid) [Streptomyces sp. BI20]|uniref:thioesterase II family protein n=1 Tax=Streptomyces sp. BI20 TaxID=3403460 RepID=UPI003C7618CC